MVSEKVSNFKATPNIKCCCAHWYFIDNYNNLLAGLASPESNTPCNRLHVQIFTQSWLRKIIRYTACHKLLARNQTGLTETIIQRLCSVGAHTRYLRHSWKKTNPIKFVIIRLVFLVNLTSVFLRQPSERKNAQDCSSVDSLKYMTDTYCQSLKDNCIRKTEKQLWCCQYWLYPPKRTTWRPRGT